MIADKLQQMIFGYNKQSLTLAANITSRTNEYKVHVYSNHPERLDILHVVLNLGRLPVDWNDSVGKSRSSFLKPHFDFQGKQLIEIFLLLSTKMLSETGATAQRSSQYVSRGTAKIMKHKCSCEFLLSHDSAFTEKPNNKIILKREKVPFNFSLNFAFAACLYLAGHSCDKSHGAEPKLLNSRGHLRKTRRCSLSLQFESRLRGVFWKHRPENNEQTLITAGLFHSRWRRTQLLSMPITRSGRSGEKQAVDLRRSAAVVQQGRRCLLHRHRLLLGE